MRQRRFARRTDHDFDLLSPVTAPRKLLGADHLIVGKSGNDCTRVSTSGNNTSFIVRDQYSGMGLASPQKGRNQDSNYRYLKFFVGVAGHRPDVMVRSDTALEITSAVQELGWHPEPSLANKWPHNAVHERWIGTLKSVIRTNMMQSGFPASAWDFAIQFSAITLSIAKPAPIHAWEKDATGAILDEFQHKVN